MDDHRPAVILPRLRYVDLVAATRSVLRLPQLSRRRVDRQSFLAAMPVRPDLRQRSGLAAEGIARGRFAFRCDANDLAQVVIEFLRPVPGRRLGAIANRDEEIP